MPQTVSIAPEHAGTRLDKFLADFDANTSRAVWQKRIKSGRVRVNDRTVQPDYPLKAGDELVVLPEEPAGAQNYPVVDLPILYEDADVIVLDKPHGVISQRAATSNAPAVTDFLVRHHPPIQAVGEDEQRCGLVHRLDKDTSGLLIAAKHQAAFDFLKQKFQRREVEKTYTALAYGKVEPPAGEIDLAISRHPKFPCRQTVVREPEHSTLKSRPARTLYRTIQRFDGFTLLAVSLKTGRMHQIRVHLEALGHPVAGDPKYAAPRLLRQTPTLERQFLHASELEIPLPSGQKGHWRSALPTDLADFLRNLDNLD